MSKTEFIEKLKYTEAERLVLAAKEEGLITFPNEMLLDMLAEVTLDVGELKELFAKMREDKKVDFVTSEIEKAKQEAMDKRNAELQVEWIKRSEQ